MQIINCIPKEWKTQIKFDAGNSVHFCVFTPHLLLGAKIYPMCKLTSKELYNLSLTQIVPPLRLNKNLIPF